MPPRLSHHKSRLGCTRCKARKVKCDEGKPRCGACARHAVPCEYPGSAAVQPDPKEHGSNGVVKPRPKDDLLEMQLMHEWVAYVCESICTTWRFWRYQAPQIAFKFRHALDAMLALSALHASRQKPRRWITVEGRMASIEDGRVNSMPLPDNAVSGEKEWVGIDGEPVPSAGQPETDKDLNVFDHAHMLHISRVYFDRALEGQQRALPGLTADNARAVFMCSILVSYYALFTLSEDSQSPDLPVHDPIQWFRLARGTTLIVTQWMSFARAEWFEEAGAMYGAPDLTDERELFHPDHRKPFAYLLDPVGDDIISPTDRMGYENALSYFGLIYKGFMDGSDTPLATCRRVVAMPARLYDRFSGLVVDEQQPRALAILAHVFAVTKLIDHRVPWFKGIAERQVPNLCRSLPEAWQEKVAWPMQVVAGFTGPPSAM